MTTINKPIFLFDLDGTITTEEILPKVAREIGLEEEIRHLTVQTIAGDIPFEHSFNVRVDMLRRVPIPTVKNIVNNIPLNTDIVRYIKNNKHKCRIVTGNLDVWIDSAVRKLGVGCHSSEAETTKTGMLVKAKKILRKRNIVDLYQQQNYFVVAIGDGNNDAEMLAAADLSIAFGGVHPPAKSALTSTQYVIYDGKKLCQFIQRLS